MSSLCLVNAKTEILQDKRTGFKCNISANSSGPITVCVEELLHVCPSPFAFILFLDTGELTSISGLIFVSVCKVLLENNLKPTSSLSLAPRKYSPDTLTAELDG